MRPIPAQATSADGTVGSLRDELGTRVGEEPQPLRASRRLRITIASAGLEREVIDIETATIASWFQPQARGRAGVCAGYNTPAQRARDKEPMRS
jgi:hypothetical protein